VSRYVVAGASGFIGRSLVPVLLEQGHEVVCLGRQRPDWVPNGAAFAVTGFSYGELRPVLGGADVVVNLAARVHRRGETAQKYLPLYMTANRDLAVTVAKAARDSAVRRLVQMSSVAAICSVTSEGEIVDDSTPPHPTTPYGVSKLAADEQLADLCGDGFSVVCLRPPAVYGRGAPGPFGPVAKLARMGLALPLDRAKALRSLIYVENLVSAIITAGAGSASGAFIVTDSSPLSVAEINRRIGEACGAGLAPGWFSPGLLDIGSRVALGRKAEALLSPAAYDGARFRQTFDWQPPISLEEAFQRAFAA
jgi:nucleoside-diphosphate-sugar epimerase